MSTKRIQLWRMLEPEDVIQPGDHFASSLTGHVCRCTPGMMGRRLPYLHMPHLRPAGEYVETTADNSSTIPSKTAADCPERLHSAAPKGSK